MAWGWRWGSSGRLTHEAATRRPPPAPRGGGAPPPTYDEALVALYALRGLSRPRTDARSRKASVAALVDEVLAEPGNLRSDQVGFLDALARHARDRRAAPVVSTVQPGGSGKTTVVMRLLERVAASVSPPRTILLEPTRVILAQVRRAVAAWPGADAASVMVGGARRPGVVTAMTHARFAGLVAEGTIGPDDVDLLVVDEAHRMLSELRGQVLDRFLGRTYVLAATASPTFSEAKAVDRLLGADNRVWTTTAQAMREAGVIAAVTNVVVGVRIDGPMPADRLDRALVRRQAVSEAMVAMLTRRWPVGDRTILGRTFLAYGQDVAHAEMVKDLYNAERDRPARMRCESVSGRDARGHVESVLADLEAGRVTGVSNVLLLGEGYDLPRIRVVANSPTGSTVRQIQQSARAHRVDRDDPEHGAHSFVLDFYVEENGEVNGTPRWYHEVAGEAELAERPLLFTYDTRLDHPSIAPYRGFDVAFDVAVDGAEATGGEAGGDAASPVAAADGILDVDWRIADVVELRAGHARRVGRTDDECDAAATSALARSMGIGTGGVTDAFKVLRQAARDGVASVVVEGVRLHPLWRRQRGSRQLRMCLDVDEARRLVLALDGRVVDGAARHPNPRPDPVAGRATRSALLGARAADDGREVAGASAQGAWMRSAFTKPDPVALGRFLDEARVAAGLGRPLTLADGEPLRCEVGPPRGRHPGEVLFDPAEGARVAAHLDLAPVRPAGVRALGDDHVTRERLMDANGVARGADPLAAAMWSTLSRALREGSDEATVAGVSVRPVVALGGYGASVAISIEEAGEVARAVWGEAVPRAPDEPPGPDEALLGVVGPTGRFLRPAADQRVEPLAEWLARDLRDREPLFSRLRLDARREREVARGSPLVARGRGVAPRRHVDAAGATSLLVSRDEAALLLEGVGMTERGGAFLSRGDVEASRGVVVDLTAWRVMTIQWHGGERAVGEGAAIRGAAREWKNKLVGSVHPDDVDALLASLPWAEDPDGSGRG